MTFKRFLKGLFIATLAVSFMGIQSAEAARRKKHVYRAPPDRFSQIVVEASTGYILSQQNAGKRLYPASLTKMMTLYLTFDAIDNGALGKNQRVTVSKHAAAQEPSSLGLNAGETIRVEDCILGIATKSANDCAVVLGEAVGGSEERFARMMTAKAQSLGMRNTRFLNASGLFKSGQVSSAQDMAILARALIRNHPRDYHYFGTDSFTYKGNTYLNHNKLMQSYRGMDGLKTGYVSQSGFNLTASAVRNGKRLIGVVFGGATSKSRNNTMAQLLNQGFEKLDNVPLRSIAEQRQSISAPPSLTATSAARVVADNQVRPAMQPPQSAAPQFDAMGLVIEEGDTAEEVTVPSHTEPRIIRGTSASSTQQRITRKTKTASAQNFVKDLSPRPLNTIPSGAWQPKTSGSSQFGASGSMAASWAVQIGAFSSHDAGLQAIRAAKQNLPAAMGGTENIVPLMTNRGMIYRARLSNVSRDTATNACRILKGNCLILTE